MAVTLAVYGASPYATRHSYPIRRRRRRREPTTVTSSRFLLSPSARRVHHRRRFHRSGFSGCDHCRYHSSIATRPGAERHGDVLSVASTLGATHTLLARRVRKTTTLDHRDARLGAERRAPWAVRGRKQRVAEAVAVVLADLSTCGGSVSAASQPGPHAPRRTDRWGVRPDPRRACGGHSRCEGGGVSPCVASRHDDPSTPSVAGRRAPPRPRRASVTPSGEPEARSFCDASPFLQAASSPTAPSPPHRTGPRPQPGGDTTHLRHRRRRSQRRERFYGRDPRCGVCARRVHLSLSLFQIATPSLCTSHAAEVVTLQYSTYHYSAYQHSTMVHNIALHNIT